MGQESFFAAFDGTKLFMHKNLSSNPKAIVIIVHGLCEHLGRYNYVAEKLHAAEYTVWRFDHRGHGRSEGKRAFYENKDEIVEDIGTVVNMAKEEHLPIYLLGHSMGGYAVSCFGTKYPGRAAGLITSGAITFNNAKFGAALPRHLGKEAYFSNELGNAVCSDPAVAEAYANDPLVEKAFSSGLVFSLLDGIDWLQATGSRLVDPILILHGADDGIVSEKDARDFYGSISSQDKTLMIFAKLYHEILNEPQRDYIIRQIIHWLDQRVGKA